MRTEYERYFAGAPTVGEAEQEQLKLEWLKLTNFIGVSEANIHVMKARLQTAPAPLLVAL
jgi:hypothetical protein